jgi:lysophospholipase L1-like esterase
MTLKRIAIGIVAFGALVALGGFSYLAYVREASKAHDYYDVAIEAFEEQDRRAPPAPGSVVFVGSSSIRMWSTLAQDMDPLPVINRGFGGSQMSHVIRYVDRIVTPYDAGAIVVYEGDNDLQAGSSKTPDSVAADFQELVGRIRAKRPEVPIYFLSIKPSTLRWPQWPEMARANALIEEICSADSGLSYIDVASPMLGQDGEPRSDIYLLDGLHMNSVGYAIWTQAIKPVLMRDLRAQR